MDLASPRQLARTLQFFQSMTIPPEIRLEVIAYVVVSASTISWHGSYIGDKVQHRGTARQYLCNGIHAHLPARYSIAAPLLVSRALYAQAAPVFYSKNAFRFRNPYPGLPLAFNSPTFTTNLRHLTIGILASSLLSERQLKRTDQANSARVDEIARLCPALRTFTNHVPRVYEFGLPVQPSPWAFMRTRRSVRVLCGVMSAVAVGLLIFAGWIFTSS